MKKETPQPDNLLAFRNICFDWPNTSGGFFRKHDLLTGKAPLLNRISFTVKEASCLSIVGESGTGKSTLGRLIAARIVPKSGCLFFRGRKYSYSEYGKKCRMHFQLTPQIPQLGFNPRLSLKKSLDDAFAAYRLCHGREKNSQLLQTFHSDLVQLCKEMEVPLSSLHRFPHEFSSGQLQRLALLRVIVTKPSLIILDEPVSFLDPILRRQMLDLIMRMHNRYKTALVIISHLMEVHQYVSGDLWILENGMLRGVQNK